MASKRLSVLVVATVVLFSTISLLAQEEGGDRPRPRGERPARGRTPTPEEAAKRAERMKASLEQRLKQIGQMAENLKARRDELAAMAGKTTVATGPPSSQLLSAQGARGGRAQAMRMAFRRRGRPDAAARPAGPTTIEVNISPELKKAAEDAAAAYGALLPILDEQRQATQADRDRAGAAEPGADREQMQARMTASRELSQRVGDAQAAVGDAEAEIELLLANAWLGAASTKLTDEDAKAAAAAAQEALANYLKLKPQLVGLEEKIGKEATALQEGLRAIMMGLMRQRATRERPPRPDAERRKPRPEAEQRKPPNL